LELPAVLLCPVLHMDSQTLQQIVSTLAGCLGWKTNFKKKSYKFGSYSTNEEDIGFLTIVLNRKLPKKLKTAKRQARDKARKTMFVEKKKREASSTTSQPQPNSTVSLSLSGSFGVPVERKDDTATTSSVPSLTSSPAQPNQKYISPTDTSLGTVRLVSPDMEIETGQWIQVSNKKGSNKRKSAQGSSPVKRNTRSSAPLRSQPVGRHVGGRPTDVTAGIKPGKPRLSAANSPDYRQAYYNVLKAKCLQASNLNCLTTSADHDCTFSAHVMSSLSGKPWKVSAEGRANAALAAFKQLQQNKLLKDVFLQTLELKTDDLQF